MKAISSDRQSCVNQLFFAALVFVIAGLFCIPAYAKNFRAHLTGLVTDPSGAVMSMAAVTAVIGTSPDGRRPIFPGVPSKTYRSKRGKSSALKEQSAIVTAN